MGNICSKLGNSICLKWKKLTNPPTQYNLHSDSESDYQEIELQKSLIKKQYSLRLEQQQHSQSLTNSQQKNNSLQNSSRHKSQSIDINNIQIDPEIQIKDPIINNPINNSNINIDSHHLNLQQQYHFTNQNDFSFQIQLNTQSNENLLSHNSNRESRYGPNGLRKNTSSKLLSPTFEKIDTKTSYPEQITHDFIQNNNHNDSQFLSVQNEKDSEYFYSVNATSNNNNNNNSNNNSNNNNDSGSNQNRNSSNQIQNFYNNNSKAHHSKQSSQFLKKASSKMFTYNFSRNGSFKSFETGKDTFSSMDQNFNLNDKNFFKQYKLKRQSTSNMENTNKNQSQTDTNNPNQYSYTYKKSKSMIQSNEEIPFSQEQIIQDNHTTSYKNLSDNEIFFDLQDELYQASQKSSLRNNQALSHFQQQQLEWLNSFNQFENQIKLDQEMWDEIYNIRLETLDQLNDLMETEQRGQNKEMYSNLHKTKTSHLQFRTELDNQNQRVIFLKGQIQVNSENIIEVLNFIEKYSMLQKFTGVDHIYKVNQEPNRHIMYASIFEPEFKKPIDFMFIKSIYVQQTQNQNQKSQKSSIQKQQKSQKTSQQKLGLITEQEDSKSESSQFSSQYQSASLKSQKTSNQENTLFKLIQKCPSQSQHDNINQQQQYSQSKITEQQSQQQQQFQRNISDKQLNHSNSDKYLIRKVDQIYQNFFPAKTQEQIQQQFKQSSPTLSNKVEDNNRILIVDVSLGCEQIENQIEEIKQQGSQRSILLRGIWLQQQTTDNKIQLSYQMQVNYNIQIPVGTVKKMFLKQHKEFLKQLQSHFKEPQQQ